jgi:hypothetical protein
MPFPRLDGRFLNFMSRPGTHDSPQERHTQQARKQRTVQIQDGDWVLGDWMFVESHGTPPVYLPCARTPCHSPSAAWQKA